MPDTRTMISALAFGGLTLLAFSIEAQTIPKPPERVCIDTDNCQATDTSVKWHPGHYMQLARGDAETAQSVRFKYYDQIGTNTAIVGVVVPFRWSQLEGATRGDYKTGMATLDAEIAKLRSLPVPKRLYVRIIDQAYDVAPPAAGYFPQYVRDAGATFGTNNGTVWRRWNATYMGWFIDMVEAYGEAFNNEPYFEGLYLTRETAGNWGGTTPPLDYSASELDRQLRRLALVAKAAWPNTNVIMPINYLTNQSTTNAHIAYLATIRVGVGGPDVLPNSDVWAYNTIVGASGGVDYRGEVPIHYSIEASELGGVLGNYLPKQLYDFANTTLRASHLFWQRNTYTGSAAQQWDTGILPFIEANPLLSRTSCPRAYSSCDTR